MPQQTFSFGITIAGDVEEAQRIQNFFQTKGIPTEIVPDPLFHYSINTDTKEHFFKALPIYESSCCIINVFTGEIVREAAWDK